MKTAKQFAALVAAGFVFTGSTVTLRAQQLREGGSPPEVMQDFGLTGRFAPDCGKPPSRENAHMSYHNENGQIRIAMDAGPTVRRYSFLIVSAMRIGTDKIVLRQQIDSTVLDVIMVRQGDRLRSMSSQRVDDGSFLIKDGIMLATGHETVWSSSCPGAR
jgi:hypothetical protein